MAGIILTGGKSIRMGQDKATMLFEGRPLLDTIAERLASVESLVYVVADTEDRYHPAGTFLRADALPDAGPAGGLFTGLLAAGEGVHLVVACDQPFLNPALLSFLKNSLTESLSRGESAVALVPEIGGRLEPLHAAYSDLALGPLRKAMRDGERSLQKLLRSLSIRTIREEELRTRDPDLLSFTNWNTPEERLPFALTE